jgi:glycosyltransferase involved in cell wall biosynthesis
VTPWLSVLIPVHDGARFLAPTLASVAAEQPEGVEILIYSSADADGAAQRIADDFADRLDIGWQDRPDLKAWPAKMNLGACAARAPHLAILHQDDLWLPGHIAALSRAIAAAPNAVMTIGPSYFAGPAGQLLGTWRLPFAPGLNRGRELAAKLLVQNNVAMPSPMIRRDAWLACGGMDEALWYTSDWDLYLKLGLTGDIMVRDTATTAFRVHGGSLTMTGSRDADGFRRQMDVVLQRYLPLLALPSGLEQRARASIVANCALAAAATGQYAGLRAAVWELTKLGPLGLARYIRQSRIFDRLMPRLRLSLTRGM